MEQAVALLRIQLRGLAWLSPGEFKVGDKVRAPQFCGIQEICGIDKSDTHPVKILLFAEGSQICYTLDGKYRGDSEPTLRHAKTGKAAVIGERPSKFEYPLFRKSNTGSKRILRFTGISTGCEWIDGKWQKEYNEWLPHTAANWTPCEEPEVFIYPLFMKSRYNREVVKFTGLRSGFLLVTSNGLNTSEQSEYHNYIVHTDRDVWEPCEEPKWIPEKPTWCWVWDKDTTSKRKRLVCSFRDNLYLGIADHQSSSITWGYAEPCCSKHIPEWWPK